MRRGIPNCLLLLAADKDFNEQYEEMEAEEVLTNPKLLDTLQQYKKYA